jgi:hypothetical protein
MSDFVKSFTNHLRRKNHDDNVRFNQIIDWKVSTMKQRFGLLMAMALIGAIQTGKAGDVTGKVTLKGKAPAAQPISTASDPQCAKSQKEPTMQRFYVVDANGGLAEVFIHIKDGLTGKTIPAAPADPVVIDQVGCFYWPYVAGVQTGQKVMVKNSDPTSHNVHVDPDPKSGNKASNRMQPAGFKPLEFSFENPEVMLRFKCDVHPWMYAYMGVVNHPYFAVSGKDGTFTIKNVPPGKYIVEAVHRKSHPGGKGVTQEVTVGAEGGKADFTIDAPAQ